jgi:hypothetical protein
MNRRGIVGGLVLALAFGVAGSLDGQFNPVNRQQPKGLGVSPTFEGFFENPDGTFTLSFGFMNRNTEQVLNIPVGPQNFVSPGSLDQGQPTYFTPRRQYGVFTVTVPANFGSDQRVTWTLEANGERYAIPGGFFRAYETDNLHARAVDRRPPVLVLEPGGEESRGPNGARIARTTKLDEPLVIRLAAWDEYDEDGLEVTLRWYKQRGPGEVTFDQQRIPLGEGSSQATTLASFSEEGEYLLYVRADHSDVRVNSAGLEQCCWTNGYVSVTVTR